MPGAPVSGSGILNADMATVSRWLRTGFGWWLAELREMVPERLLHRRERGPVAQFTPGKPIVIRQGDETALALPPGRPRPMTLVLPAAVALQRRLTVPRMGTTDLRSYVALEQERLLPIGAQSLVIDVQAERGSGDAAAGTQGVRIAAVARSTMTDALAAAAAAGVAPQRIALSGTAGPDDLQFDFAPQLRSEGLLPPADMSRVIWWSLVALAFAANVGLLVWRDQQEVEQMRQLVEAQQPAVRVYRTISGRLARTREIAARSAARRRTHDAIGDLAATSAALPTPAWVQRYQWNGAGVRLSGYMRPPFDVAAALRKEPRFINIRPGSSDLQADLPIGQPYDISADIRHGGRR